MSPDSGFLSRAGIVDRVEAVRNSAGDVIRLNVKVRAETEYQQTYYRDNKHVDEIVFSLAVDSQVNPGDVVSIQMQFASPFGDRFRPALEASTGDDDALEVMVEDGMVEEAKAKTKCGDDDCTLDECRIEEDDDDS